MRLAGAFATEVVARLKAAGFQALWAGGCVRDLILGLEPSDYDVATEATPEQVMGLFRRTVPVGVSFGVVRVLGPGGTRARWKWPPSGATEPTSTAGGRNRSTFGDARLDAERRDFTINGMFLDPMSGEVLDFVGGRADLDAKILRAIGDPAERFAEDKLRLIRAVRFAARFGMAIEAGTKTSTRGDGRSGPRCLGRADRPGTPQDARPSDEGRMSMSLAMDVGLIAAIFPPLARTRGCIPRASHPAPGRSLGPPLARARIAPRRSQLSRWRSPRCCTTSASRTRRV